MRIAAVIMFCALAAGFFVFLWRVLEAVI